MIRCRNEKYIDIFCRLVGRLSRLFILKKKYIYMYSLFLKSMDCPQKCIHFYKRFFVLFCFSVPAALTENIKLLGETLFCQEPQSLQQRRSALSLLDCQSPNRRRCRLAFCPPAPCRKRTSGAAKK